MEGDHMTPTRSRGWLRHTSLAAIALTLLSTVGLAAAAGPYERPTDRPVAEALPPDLASGPYHKVRDPIVADGYMMHFTVESTFGAFEVTGLGALRKLVRELYAIAELRKIKGTEAWAKQVRDSATSPIQFAGKLLTSPVDTVSGLPRGIYKGVEAGYSAVTTAKDPSSDSRMQTVLLQSGKKREYAAKLGVDPYSSNAALQKELNSVAWAAALGSWTVSVGTMPVSGAAGAVISMTKMGDAIGDYLKVEGPADLRIRNEKALAEMGISKDLARRFLDHKAFTPRHDTILTGALAALGGTRGREVFLEAALAGDDEVDANFYMAMAQILRGYHQTVAPLTEIRQVSGIVMAQTQSGTVLMPFPLDSAVWTERADRLSDEIKATYRARGFNGKFDLWVMGTVSNAVKQGLAQKAFTVVEQVNRRVEILD
jgi:hypothetical protein